MKILRYITYGVLFQFLFYSCLKDISETNNNEFPIKLEVQNGNVGSINWTKLTNFEFKYYLITVSKDPSEIYSKIEDIPSSSIVKKIFDVSNTKYTDSINIESVYYRVYGVTNNKLYISNEVKWLSTFIILNSSNSSYLDLCYDYTNNNLIFRSNNVLNVFDPKLRKIITSKQFTYPQTLGLGLQNLSIQDLGRGNELTYTDYYSMYFINPLTLQLNDTIKHNESCFGYYTTKDSLIHLISSSYINTYNRKTKKKIVKNNLLFNYFNTVIAYSKDDYFITGDDFDGFGIYKFDRNNNSLSIVKEEFKGISPYNFNFGNPYISSDGENLMSYNNNYLFCYDKSLKLAFSKNITNKNSFILDMKLNSDKSKLVLATVNQSNNINIEIYDTNNLYSFPITFISKLTDIYKMLVTNEYIFILGSKLNTKTSLNETILETINLN